MDHELMARIARRAVKLLVLSMTLAVVAPVFCAANDEKPEAFAPFLDRFIADESFRLARVRVPLPAAVGNAESDEVKKHRWSTSEVAANLQPPQSRKALVDKGLDEKISKLSSTHVKLFQFRPDADSYLIEYHFRRLHGRWYLTSYRDFSM